MGLERFSSNPTVYTCMEKSTARMAAAAAAYGFNSRRRLDDERAIMISCLADSLSKSCV